MAGFYRKSMTSEAIQGPFDYVYLSPHFDDVVFSCGGQIAQRTATGSSVAVVTVMGAKPPVGRLSNFAVELHTKWGVDESAVAIRKLEDQASCALVGASAIHWSIMDCIYREGAFPCDWLYSSRAAIFGRIAAFEESSIITRIGQLIAELPPHRRLVAPLAVGNHVDHQIVRKAAESFGTSVSFYEDFPYAFVDGSVDAVLGGRENWSVEQIDLSSKSRTAKAAAIEAHASQIGKYPQLRVPGAIASERIWSRR
jgi:LmbE family N-acetylglucosaminyl deacetylase